MNLQRLIGLAVVSLCLLSVGCKRTLTTERANEALNAWERNSRVFGCHCGGNSCTGAGGYAVRVTGVRELPQENAAEAILAFDAARINNGCRNQKIYTGPGEARFAHLTDGNWILTSVSTSEGLDSIVWEHIDIKVK